MENLGTVKDLNADIEAKKYHPIYIFTGEEKGLINQYVNDIKAGYKNIVETEDIKVVIDDSKYRSLLGGKKLYILKETGLFDKQATDEFVNFLVRMFKQDQINCIFVEDKINRTYKQTQCLSEKQIIEFKKLTEEQLVGFVGNVLSGSERKMTKELMRAFVEQCDYDYNTIINELTKLLNYTDAKDIKIDDVRAVTSRSLRCIVFDLVEFVVKQQYSKALELYDTLLLRKEPPLGILVLVYRQLRLLYQIKLLKPEGYSVTDIADACDSKPFIIEKNFNICNFATQKLIQLMIKCNNYDWQIKTGQISAELAIECLILHSGINKE